MLPGVLIATAPEALSVDTSGLAFQVVVGALRGKGSGERPHLGAQKLLLSADGLNSERFPSLSATDEPGQANNAAVRGMAQTTLCQAGHC
mmetsp:Transcript_15632/g.36535  ORF Transcript_15632/g.36535 Transcript_15632/m.36535 type:complete len:90 (+) Transcript_15632:95-364(+)